MIKTVQDQNILKILTCLQNAKLATSALVKENNWRPEYLPCLMLSLLRCPWKLGIFRCTENDWDAFNISYRCNTISLETPASASKEYYFMTFIGHSQVQLSPCTDWWRWRPPPPPASPSCRERWALDQTLSTPWGSSMGRAASLSQSEFFGFASHLHFKIQLCWASVPGTQAFSDWPRESLKQWWPQIKMKTTHQRFLEIVLEKRQGSRMDVLAWILNITVQVETKQ